MENTATGTVNAYSEPSPSESGFGHRLVPLCLVVIVCATMGIYSSLPGQDFTNWDDPKHVAAVWKPDLERAWRIVTDFKLKFTHVAYYIPVHFLSLMADQALVLPEQRPQPWIAKLMNMVFHTLNACLLLMLLLAAGLSRGTALIGALTFAVHPIQVGTVAWVAERKNLLSCFFYLISLRLFVAYLASRRASWLAVLVVVFILGLLSKPSMVTLPVALAAWLVLVAGPEQRSRASFVVVGCLMGISLLWGLFVISTEVSYPGILPPWYARPLLASGVIWFYVATFFWPVGLVPVYPRWDVMAHGLALGGLFLLLALCAGVAIRWRKMVDPLVLWGLAIFVLNVLPVSGLIPFGYMGHSFVSDHLAYLSMVGLATATAAGVEQLLRVIPRSVVRRTVVAGVCAMIAILAGLTVKQTRVWDDATTLWEATLKVNETSAAVYHNYGTVLMDRGEYEPALAMLRRAAELAPSLDVSYSRMGRIYRLMGDREQARAMFRRAVEVNPRALTPWLMLGMMFREEGKLPDALEVLRRAVKEAPDAGVLHNELGICYRMAGRDDDALPAFQEAIRADPMVSDPYWRMAEILLARGEVDKPIALLTRALQLNENPNARNLLGVAFTRRGDMAAALKEFTRAHQLRPDLHGVCDNIANSLMDTNEFPKAEAFCAQSAKDGRPCAKETLTRLQQERSPGR